MDKGALTVTQALADKATAWTVEMDAMLQLGRNRGHSFSTIAKAMTRHLGREVSRSAVIGRAKRTGLTMPAEQALHARAIGNVAYRTAQAKAATPRPPRLPSQPVVKPSVLSPHRRPWIDREPGECKFPLEAGDRPADWHSCCNPAKGSGYCTGHEAVVYERPPAPPASSKPAAANQTRKAA